jgi:hypothetical protein
MPLSRLNDVKFSHNVVERVLGCGTLVVESAGEVGQLVLTDVPRVEQVQRTLYRLSDGIRAAATGAPAPALDAALDNVDPDDNATQVLDRRHGRDAP